MRRLPLAAAILAVAHAVSLAGQPADDELARLATDSPMIFLGTVVSQPSPSRVTTVRVDVTYRGADTIGDFTKQEIIVQRGAAYTDQKRAIFFVTPAIYGKTLEVREIGERMAPDDPTSFAADLARVERAESDRKLLARLSSAEVVVIGRVMTVAPLDEEKRSRASEHDPEWALARVAIARALKGTPRVTDCDHDKCADVVFARSVDIRWFGAPKLRPGDQAIFLLRHDTQNLLRPEERPRVDAYLLIAREDLRSLAEEQRIRLLLSRLR